jgi:predicted nucleotidyltransferase
MINVAEHDLKTIMSLLEKHIPECEVRAFGSRVSWTSKEHSDLDLVVIGPAKLERSRVEELKEAFEESLLPFIVDVMDWHRISPEFQKNIEKSFVVIKKPGSGKKTGWKYYKVSDFAEVIGGGTPRTEVAEYWNGDIPWITPKDLSSHQARRISRGERNITQEG